jgi:Sulfatase
MSDETTGKGMRRRDLLRSTAAVAAASTGTAAPIQLAQAQAPAPSGGKRPNIVMLMTDDTGWNDFGCYSGGGAGLGHPTPNVDRLAKEGAVFTCWYGQASCTAGRAPHSSPDAARSVRRCPSSSLRATRTTCVRKRRRLPSSSRRTATQPTFRGNGTSGTSRKRTRSRMASTR